MLSIRLSVCPFASKPVLLHSGICLSSRLSHLSCARPFIALGRLAQSLYSARSSNALCDIQLGARPFLRAAARLLRSVLCEPASTLQRGLAARSSALNLEQVSPRARHRRAQPPPGNWRSPAIGRPGASPSQCSALSVADRPLCHSALSPALCCFRT